MLDKLGSLGEIFTQKNAGHPLATASDLKAAIAAISPDDAFRAVDEIIGWLDSLRDTEDFPRERLFETLRQLDDAAQPHLRRLTGNYLHAARAGRAEKKRLWAINHGFWLHISDAYERCLPLLGQKDKAGEVTRRALPVLLTRLIGALAALLKWEHFHNGPLPATLWTRMGAALLCAEEHGVAGKAVAHRARSATSSPQAEYIKAVAFQAASMDSLLAHEIELAERLIEHYAGSFSFTSEAHVDSVYWVDLLASQPPQRLARMPREARSSQRFFKPAGACRQFEALLKGLERGDDFPADIALGGPFVPKVLIPVLRHLAAYLAAIPPQRTFDRHRVRNRMLILNGLSNAFKVFSSQLAEPAGVAENETWVVENVSRGGFGALLSNLPGDWLQIGALLAMQPEGGENWLLGVVRRYGRASDNDARVGIQTLATKVTAVKCRPRVASSYVAASTLMALVLEDGNPPGEVRVVLPLHAFDLGESLDYQHDGQHFLLHPVARLEQASNYEVGRYRRQTQP